MHRSVFARIAVIVAAVVAVACAAPAATEASPLRPGTHEVIGIAEGVQLAVQVTGNDLAYTVRDVPRVPLPFPPGASLPGTCQIAAIDVIKALPIIGPDLLDLIRGGESNIDVVELLQQLTEADAIAAVNLTGVADRQNVASSEFQDLPRGVYAVLAVCNALGAIGGNTPPYAVTGAIVLGGGFSSGSSTDEGSTGSSSGSASGSSGS
ncbi:hypothetical protein AAFP35_00565 [Gordonia sp. CPCC 206044]|uniref:hypothetical protein n=1 Tax=Gordonia sp. CPCC 206044 TaxID=3140793 RepID=UPI003AF40032